MEEVDGASQTAASPDETEGSPASAAERQIAAASGSRSPSANGGSRPSSANRGSPPPSAASDKRQGSKRRASVKNSQIVDDEEAPIVDDERNEPHGLLHDYVRRMQCINKRNLAARQRRRRQEAERAGTQYTEDPTELVRATKRPCDYEAVYVFEREKINASLKDEMTRFWKHCDHKSKWERESVAVITSHIKTIVNHKQQVKCLKIETATWLWKEYVLKSRLREKTENKEERYDRLQDFWTQMHGKHADSAPPKGNNPELAAIGRQKSKNAALKSLKTLQDPTAVWHNRAARSKCSFGKWNPAWGQVTKDVDVDVDRGPVDWWEEVHSASASYPDWADIKANSTFLEDNGSPRDKSRPRSGPSRPRSGASPSRPRSGASRPESASAFKEASCDLENPETVEDMFAPQPYPARSLLRWWKKDDEKTYEETTTLKPSFSVLKEKKRVANIRKTTSLPSLTATPLASSRAESLNGTSKDIMENPRALQSALSRGGLSQPSSAGALLRSSFAIGPGRGSLQGNSIPPSARSSGGGSSGSAKTLSTLDLPRVLPPIMASTSVEPWQGRVPAAHNNKVSAPKNYLKSCQKDGIIPTLVPYATGHSLKLKAANLSLSDLDLVALTAMVKTKHPMEEVDLSGNTMLKDSAIVPFIDGLYEHPYSTGLRRLKLCRCSAAGQGTVQSVVNVMNDDDGICKLQLLDLSHIQMNFKSHAQLAKAIKIHPSLTDVSLADTGMTGSPLVKKWVVDIASSTTLTSLDLSWNCFSREVFVALGQMIVETANLKTLNVASCAAEDKTSGGITPVMYLLEQLSQNATLERLELAINHIDYRGALVIEDTFDKHKKLQFIGIGDNPLGVLGMRCFLRLLSRDSSGLTLFDCEGCCTGSPEDSMDELYSVTNPGGRYSLDLARPYSRALLRMLYKVAEQFKVVPGDAFLDLTPKDWSHATKDSRDLWVVPTEGKLTFNFSVDRALEAAFKGIEDFDFGGYLQKHFDFLRVTPGFRKMVPMLAQWKSLDGRVMEQSVFLAAMAQDFQLTYPFIEMLCQSRSMALQTVEKLLPCVKGGVPAQYLTMMLTPSLGEFMMLLNRTRSLLYFNVENPTGHYKFDLGMSTDYNVAEQLVLVDRWEANVDYRLKRFDTSQKGNRSHFRNERFQDRELPYSSLAEFNMPEHDVLEFDYSTGKRPNSDTLVIADETFNRLLLSLSDTKCKELDQVESMRLVSHYINLTALQFRKLLGIYKDPEPRTELFIVFFFRIIDIWNEKVFRVRFEKQADVAALQDRLGYATFFPYIQPEQYEICLNFKHYDERLAANCLVALCAKENRANIRQPSYVYPDGTPDPLPLGVPRSWDVFEKMPQVGTFKGVYVCSAEERHWPTRKQYLETYGFWSCPVPADEVMWWASLTEAPEDVLEFLEFLSGNYTDVFKAFTDIDGVGGNGQITFKEFAEGIDEIKCKKFNDPPDQKTQRIRAVFRYLDPSGEGQVSEGEWGVLEYLYNEIKLSIKEFVQFLERTFDGDLQAAWEFLDESGDGTVDQQEWTEAVNKIGYFGPTAPIFSFLDKDDEGDVSYDEYEALFVFASPEFAHLREEAAGDDAADGDS